MPATAGKYSPEALAEYLKKYQGDQASSMSPVDAMLRRIEEGLGENYIVRSQMAESGEYVSVGITQRGLPKNSEVVLNMVPGVQIPWASSRQGGAPVPQIRTSSGSLYDVRGFLRGILHEQDKTIETQFVDPYTAFKESVVAGISQWQSERKMGRTRTATETTMQQFLMGNDLLGLPGKSTLETPNDPGWRRARRELGLPVVMQNEAGQSIAPYQQKAVWNHISTQLLQNPDDRWSYLRDLGYISASDRDVLEPTRLPGASRQQQGIGGVVGEAQGYAWGSAGVSSKFGISSAFRDVADLWKGEQRVVPGSLTTENWRSLGYGYTQASLPLIGGRESMAAAEIRNVALLNTYGTKGGGFLLPGAERYEYGMESNRYYSLADNKKDAGAFISSLLRGKVSVSDVAKPGMISAGSNPTLARFTVGKDIRPIIASDDESNPYDASFGARSSNFMLQGMSLQMPRYVSPTTGEAVHFREGLTLGKDYIDLQDSQDELRKRLGMDVQFSEGYSTVNLVARGSTLSFGKYGGGGIKASQITGGMSALSVNGMNIDFVTGEAKSEAAIMHSIFTSRPREIQGQMLRRFAAASGMRSKWKDVSSLLNEPGLTDIDKIGRTFYGENEGGGARLMGEMWQTLFGNPSANSRANQQNVRRFGFGKTGPVDVTMQMNREQWDFYRQTFIATHGGDNGGRAAYDAMFTETDLPGGEMKQIVQHGVEGYAGRMAMYPTLEYQSLKTTMSQEEIAGLNELNPGLARFMGVSPDRPARHQSEVANAWKSAEEFSGTVGSAGVIPPNAVNVPENVGRELFQKYGADLADEEKDPVAILSNIQADLEKSVGKGQMYNFQKGDLNMPMIPPGVAETLNQATLQGGSRSQVPNVIKGAMQDVLNRYSEFGGESDMNRYVGASKFFGNIFEGRGDVYKQTRGRGQGIVGWGGRYLWSPGLRKGEMYVPDQLLKSSLAQAGVPGRFINKSMGAVNALAKAGVLFGAAQRYPQETSKGWIPQRIVTDQIMAERYQKAGLTYVPGVQSAISRQTNEVGIGDDDQDNFKAFMAIRLGRGGSLKGVRGDLQKWFTDQTSSLNPEETKNLQFESQALAERVSSLNELSKDQGLSPLANPKAGWQSYALQIEEAMGSRAGKAQMGQIYNYLMRGVGFGMSALGTFTDEDISQNRNASAQPYQAALDMLSPENTGIIDVMGSVSFRTSKGFNELYARTPNAVGPWASLDLKKGTHPGAFIEQIAQSIGAPTDIKGAGKIDLIGNRQFAQMFSRNSEDARKVEAKISELGLTGSARAQALPAALGTKYDYMQTPIMTAMLGQASRKLERASGSDDVDRATEAGNNLLLMQQAISGPVGQAVSTQSVAFKVETRQPITPLEAEIFARSPASGPFFSTQMATIKELYGITRDTVPTPRMAVRDSSGNIITPGTPPRAKVNLGGSSGQPPLDPYAGSPGGPPPPSGGTPSRPPTPPDGEPPSGGTPSSGPGGNVVVESFGDEAIKQMMDVTRPAPRRYPVAKAIDILRANLPKFSTLASTVGADIQKLPSLLKDIGITTSDTMSEALYEIANNPAVAAGETNLMEMLVKSGDPRAMEALDIIKRSGPMLSGVSRAVASAARSLIKNPDFHNYEDIRGVAAHLESMAGDNRVLPPGMGKDDLEALVGLSSSIGGYDQSETAMDMADLEQMGKLAPGRIPKPTTQGQKEMSQFRSDVVNRYTDALENLNKVIADSPGNVKKLTEAYQDVGVIAKEYDRMRSVERLSNLTGVGPGGGGGALDVINAAKARRSQIESDWSRREPLPGERKEYDALTENIQAYQESTAGLLKASQQKQQTGSLGHIARTALGGFGLMYIRSMGGAIMGATEMGYQEQLALTKNVNAGMAQYQGYGNIPNDPEAEIARARSAYGSGYYGLRMLQASALRNQPGMVAAGQSLFAGGMAFGLAEWAAGLSPALGGISAAAPYIGMGVAAATYGINVWGASQDLPSSAGYMYNRGLALPGGRSGRAPTILEAISPQYVGGTLADVFGQKYGETSKLANAYGALDSALGDKFKTDISLKSISQLLGPGQSLSGVLGYYAQNVLAQRYPEIQGEYLGQSLGASLFYGAEMSESNIAKMAGVMQQGYDIPSVARAMASTPFADYKKIVSGAGSRMLPLTALAQDQQGLQQLQIYQAGTQRAGQLGAYFDWGANNLNAIGQMGSAQFGLLQQAYSSYEQQQIYGIPGAAPSVQYYSGITAATYTGAQQNLTADQMRINQWQGLQSGTYSGAFELYMIKLKQGLPTGQEPDANKYVGLPPEVIAQIKKSQEIEQANLGQVTGAQGQAFSSAYDIYFRQLRMGKDAVAPSMEKYYGMTAPQLATEMGNQYAQNLALSGYEINPRTGVPSGQSWGSTTLAYQSPVFGPMSAQEVAGLAWGQNWAQNDIMMPNGSGGRQGLMSAMTNGVKMGLPGGGSVKLQGQQAYQYMMSNLQYENAMASAGIQMAQWNVNYAFTTGVGLNKYNTINPQTGEPFGFNQGKWSWSIPGIGKYTSEGGGAWGAQDAQRNLGYAQQEWGFKMQESQMALQSRQFYENFAMNKYQAQTQRGWQREDWQFQDQQRGMQWQWRLEDFNEEVRFMTGRQRKLAERGMKRETITHNLEEDQIDRQKSRQEVLWKMEDERFAIQKKQFEDSKRLQEEQLNMAKKFYEEGKKMQEELVKLQRAEWVENMNLQKASIGLAAKQAEEQKKVNDAMLAFMTFQSDIQGLQEIIANGDDTQKRGAIEAINAIIVKWNELRASLGLPPVPTQQIPGSGGSGTPTPSNPGDDPLPQQQFAGTTFAGTTTFSNPWGNTTTIPKQSERDQQVVIPIYLGGKKIDEYIVNVVDKRVRHG